MKKTRYISKSFLTAFIVCASVLAALSCPVSTRADTIYTNTAGYTNSFSTNADFDEKIEILKEAFPDGWYWNYHTESELGSKKQKKVTINNKSTYISTLKCQGASSKGNHDSNTDRSACQSNKYTGAYHGIQCYGFARMIFNMLWGAEEAYVTHVTYDSDSNCLDLLLPGDAIRAGGHSLIVTQINDDGTIKYVDCNGYGRCTIQWDHDKNNKSYLTAGLETLEHWKTKIKTSGYVALHDPNASYQKRYAAFDNESCYWNTYRALKDYNLRRTASLSSAVIQKMPAETIFFVDENRQVTNNDGGWAFVKTEEGIYGWVKISATDYWEKIDQATPPKHVTLYMNETYYPLDTSGVFNAVSFSILHGEGEIITQNDDHSITAIKEGFAQYRLTNAKGETADVAVTVYPDDTVYFEIYENDEFEGENISSDADREFKIYLIGPGDMQNVTFSWSVTDSSVLKIVSRSEDGVYCTVRAVGNGDAELQATMTIESNNPYYNEYDTWEAKYTLKATSVNNQFAEYKVVYKNGLWVREAPGTSATILTPALGEGTYFWADMSDLVEADGSTWAYCYIESNERKGWIAINNRSLVIPVDRQSGMIDWSLDADVVRIDQSFSATCLDQRMKNIQWSTSHSGILELSTWGDDNEFCMLTAVGVGTTVVTVTDGTYTYKRAFVVKKQEVSALTWDAGVSVATWENEMWCCWNGEPDEVFRPGTRAMLELLDNSIVYPIWSTSDPEILEILPDSENRRCCYVNALKPGSATISVAGIESPVFIIPDQITTVVNGSTLTFIEDIESEENDTWTLYSIGNADATSITVPSVIEGHPVVSVTHGCTEENDHLQSLTLENGIRTIKSRAFAYNLMKLRSVYLPQSLELIESDAFVFDYMIFVDFYFENDDLILADNAIDVDTDKLGENSVYGNNYRIIFHCSADSNAGRYALARGWHVVDDSPASGACGDNVQWELEDGTLTISGQGAMDNLETENQQPWFDKCESIQQIVIEEGVTSIGDQMFVSLPALHSIYIPSSVKSIPGSALSNCVSLLSINVSTENKDYTVQNNVLFNKNMTSLLAYPAGSGAKTYTIPQSVTTIDYNAFSRSKLTNMVIPDTVTDISSFAFAYCDALKTISLSSNLTNISGLLFYQCPHLESITIGNKVTDIGTMAFDGCTSLQVVIYQGTQSQWRRIEIAAGNTALDNAAIRYDPRINIKLPAHTTVIESEAFAGIPDGSVVYIPDSVTVIAADAFNGVRDITICSQSGSYAQYFASEQGYDFIDSDEVLTN